MTGEDGDDPTFEIELRLLLEAVYLRYHHDFRRYAPATLRRRVVFAAQRLGCQSLSVLQDRVLRDESAFLVLLAALTVPVTEMFRDPSFFRALREQVAPVLRTYPTCKVWVAGCSTGEEVYSLAILLREEGLGERTLIYATDINPESLARAEAGVYARDRLAGWSAAYLAAGGRASLAEYCRVGDEVAVLDPTLRRNLVFADHSLATDEVFAEVELVVCRNVLIYFDRILQDRAIGLFHGSLGHKGFLALGSKESLELSPHAPAFLPWCREERIYQKR